jgi:hypothetical protein
MPVTKRASIEKRELKDNRPALAAEDVHRVEELFQVRIAVL